MSDEKTQKIYNSKRWRELRARVLLEEPVCHWCGARKSTEADHLQALVDGGDPYDFDNLVGSCKPCNSRRGQAAGQAQRSQKMTRSTSKTAPRVFGLA